MLGQEWNEWLIFQSEQDWGQFTEDQQRSLIASSEHNAGDVHPDKQLDCMKETLKQYLDGELDPPY